MIRTATTMSIMTQNQIGMQDDPEDAGDEVTTVVPLLLVFVSTTASFVDE